MKTKERKACTVEFFKAAEEVTGPLSQQQREAIADAVEVYLFSLEFLSNSKSPAAVQKELTALATSAGNLAKMVNELSREARLALYDQPGAEHVVNDRKAFAESMADLQSAVSAAIETSIRGRWSVLEAGFFGREEPYKVLPKGKGPPHQTAREIFFIHLLGICPKAQTVEKLLPVFVSHGILRRGEIPHADAARKAIDKAQKSAMNPRKNTAPDTPL